MGSAKGRNLMIGNLYHLISNIFSRLLQPHQFCFTMSTYHIFPLLLAIMLGSAQCNTQPMPVVSGKIALSEGWKPVVYLVQPRNFSEIAANYSGVVLDSAAIAADGHFEFSKVALSDEQALFQICIQRAGNRFPNQLLDDNPLIANYMPVVLQKGTPLVVGAEAAQLQATFSIETPRAENLALLKLRDIRHQAYKQHLLGKENHADENTLLEHEDALRQFRQPLMAFADSSTLLWPGLVAVRWVSPASDFERVPEFLFGQCQKWSSESTDNPWVAQLCKAGNREKLPVLAGDIIPNYPLPMAAGDTVLLHQLLGSKLTVLDIWASWCAPCRRENREVLSPLYVQYREKGLQILGYSIDSSPAAWKAAMAKDGAAWPHASHLSGDATPFMETLRITTIPANFILDANGKVLAKNLHGDDLRDFIKDYFK